MKYFPSKCLIGVFLGLVILLHSTPLTASEDHPIRNLKSFQPMEDTSSNQPNRYIYQLLLDRERVDGFDSYLLQILFRGQSPDSHSIHLDSNFISLDFPNTGKALNRITKLSNGVIESSELGIFKKSTRLLLYTSQSIHPTIRHTIDRTLIHFKVPLNKR